MGAEIYAVIGVLFTGWVAWISLTTIQNNAKISGLMSIKNGMTRIEDDVKGINNRLDIFIKNELDALKEIAEKK